MLETRQQELLGHLENIFTSSFILDDKARSFVPEKTFSAKSNISCGLCYKHIMISNNASWVIKMTTVSDATT